MQHKKNVILIESLLTDSLFFRNICIFDAELKLIILRVLAARHFLLISILFFSAENIFSQGNISGGLQLRNDYYIRDVKRKAAGIPHYDNLKSSVDSWLDLTYYNTFQKIDSTLSFSAGMRLELYQNSNLHNPGTPYSAQGVGYWFVKAGYKGLKITGGYFYDQIGTGIIFRAYEDRMIGIDNALLGVRLEYKVKDFLNVKAFTGAQKYRFQIYSPIIKGLNFESNVGLGKEKKVSLIPGIGAVNRTLDQDNMNLIVSTIETYSANERFAPKYNVYLFSAYNTLNLGDFSWYVEAAYKTAETIRDYNNKFFQRDGSVLYTTLNYSIKGLGVDLIYKRTENFSFRTSPNESLVRGMVSYIPQTARQNSLRLLSRYNAATQELEENAFAANATYTPNSKTTFDFNFSNITDLNNKLLYREAYGDVRYKINKKWQVQGGLQYFEYNQKFYEREAWTTDNRNIQGFAPFTEILWRVNRKHSLRMEYQLLFSDEDFGGWMYGLLEYELAPWFSVSVADMWNYKPNPLREPLDLHFYSVFSSFSWGPHRLTLAFVKQVEGIVCTGGICRYEPAFSGVRVGITTSF
jgi:hypothetical protein